MTTAKTGKARVAAAPLYAVTRDMAEELAGRVITDGEAARIAKAIEYSTVSECVSEAVFQVCGSAEEDDADDDLEEN
jgi:hypothetical protein